MAISSLSIGNQIYGMTSLVGFTGRDLRKLCTALGSAVYNHILLPNLVTATVNGTAGPVGTIIHVAVVGIVPTVMSNLMKVKAAQVGFKGRDMGKLFTGVSNGVFSSLSAMQLQGTVAGCAVGAGTGRFIGINARAMGALIKGHEILKDIKGRDIVKLADVFSFGIVTQLKQSATFTVTVAGAVAPVPPAGPVAVVSIPSVFSKII